jgi:hypothetical protein
MSSLTIGRIVHYTLDEEDVTSIERSRGVLVFGVITGPAGNRIDRGQTYPAMIVRVHTPSSPSSVNLQVFLDGDDSYWATSVGESDYGVPGFWAWPERPES